MRNMRSVKSSMWKGLTLGGGQGFGGVPLQCDLVKHYIESAQQGLYRWKYVWKAWLIVILIKSIYTIRVVLILVFSHGPLVGWTPALQGIPAHTNKENKSATKA